jgi:hypothetical protein
MNAVITPITAACQVCKYKVTDICMDCIKHGFDRFDPDTEIPFWLLPNFDMNDYRELPGKVKRELLAFFIIKLLEGFDDSE